MNKSSAKTKIIIWSIVLGLVIFIFIGVNIFRGLMRSYPTGNTWNEGEGMIKEETIAADIKDISINWIAGDVTIHKTDKNEIKLIQKAPKNMDKDRLLSANVSGNSLTIRDGNKNRFFFFFSWPKRTSLDVYLPEKVYDSFYFSGASTNFQADALESERLSIDSTSGSININGTFKESFFSSTSGEIRSQNLISDSLKIDMTSGDTDIDGSFKDLSIDATSGNIDITSSTMLEALRSDSTSGNVAVSIPENEGFTLTLDKTSGNFNNDFSTAQNGDQYIYKNGSGKFNVAIVSGNFNLRMN